MNWLEVRLTVSGELAEPVAEVLSRYCQGGVVITGAEGKQEISTETSEVTVAGYLANDPEQAQLAQRIREGFWHLSQIQPIPEPTFQTIEEMNWAETWRQHYKPVQVGSRLLISPPWIETETDRLVIKIEPGMAFGTGTHPTTVLSLQLIERHLAPAASVADLGCGSGILSIASIKLGAELVRAYDIDPESVTATHENAAANQVLDQVTITHGSFAELAADIKAGFQPQLIVANILASVLMELLGAGLGRITPEGSRLILSGILEDQYGEVKANAARSGLIVVEELRSRDWVAVAIKKTRSQGEHV